MSRALQKTEVLLLLSNSINSGIFGSILELLAHSGSAAQLGRQVLLRGALAPPVDSGRAGHVFILLMSRALQKTEVLLLLSNSINSGIFGSILELLAHSGSAAQLGRQVLLRGALAPPVDGGRAGH